VVGDAGIFARHLLRWYDRFRRDLPWRISADRPGPLDPYHVLVSETMLQQTQVATVIPYFNRFIARFPDFTELAAAEEQEVLRLWQGLGYYSRARNLQAAARQIVTEHGGLLPSEHEQLLKLPGIGRYTAGAVGSIAFGKRVPILDGNVTRVISRVDAIADDTRDAKIQKLLWSRAAEILPRKRVGDFNSALMELGAIVCTPKGPRCMICPVCKHCEAFAARTQDKIPMTRKPKPIPLIRRLTYCIQREGKWLIEQRPMCGRWAGMWQFITLAAPDTKTRESCEKLPVSVRRRVHIGSISHALTHRRYEFEVFIAPASACQTKPGNSSRKWVTLSELEQFPLPRPHVRIAQMLRDSASGPRPDCGQLSGFAPA
jgi:A/G-specific adenine glycosylase